MHSSVLSDASILLGYEGNELDVLLSIDFFNIRYMLYKEEHI